MKNLNQLFDEVLKEANDDYEGYGSYDAWERAQMNAKDDEVAKEIESNTCPDCGHMKWECKCEEYRKSFKF